MSGCTRKRRNAESATTAKKCMGRAGKIVARNYPIGVTRLQRGLAALRRIHRGSSSSSTLPAKARCIRAGGRYYRKSGLALKRLHNPCKRSFKKELIPLISKNLRSLMVPFNHVHSKLTCKNRPSMHLQTEEQRTLGTESAVHLPDCPAFVQKDCRTRQCIAVQCGFRQSASTSSSDCLSTCAPRFVSLY